MNAETRTAGLIIGLILTVVMWKVNDTRIMRDDAARTAGAAWYTASNYRQEMEAIDAEFRSAANNHADYHAAMVKRDQLCAKMQKDLELFHEHRRVVVRSPAWIIYHKSDGITVNGVHTTAPDVFIYD